MSQFLQQHHSQKTVDQHGYVRIDQYRYHPQQDYLGKGSFGTVFKGVDVQNKSTVAIKVMSLVEFKDPKYKEMMKSEIVVMQQLNNNPHVVQILNFLVDQYDQYLFIIMEYCEDGDLRKYMVKAVRFVEKQAKEILWQILLGLQELIKHGYIHRDIKPENCLIKDKAIKIADFGAVAKLNIKGTQRLEETVGTPLYMSPQILNKQPYSAKTDIWSIGMMYYEMLVGRTPWPCHDMETYRLSIKNSPLRFPIDLKLSKETMSFLCQCLTVDESKRLGWDEVLNHPLFKSEVQLTKNIQFTINEKNIMTLLQQRWDTDKLSDYLPQQDQNQINFLQFYSLLQKLDPRFNKDEAHFLFKRFDENGDNMISYDEFSKIFKEYDFSNIDDLAKPIRIALFEIIQRKNIDFLNKKEFEQFIRFFTPGLPIYDIQRLYQYYDINQDGKISMEEFNKGFGRKFQDSPDKIQRALGSLKVCIKLHNIDVKKLFQKFETSGDGVIDKKEFFELIKRVDQTVTQEESFILFQEFDQSNMGFLDINSFCSRLTN